MVIEGKSVLVTGASRGLGRALAGQAVVLVNLGVVRVEPLGKDSGC